MSQELKTSYHYRALLDQLLATLPAFPEHRFHGRGIVLCGGGSVYFPCIWICVRILRRFGCTLPIELWYRGTHEMNDEMKALLEPYDVACIDSFAMARQFPVRKLDGWELKPYAILNSRFAEVLYIDADNVVVQNPEFLFESALYQATGSLFWQDLPNNASDQSYLKDSAWDLLDLPFRNEPQFESGQLLIDKRRCWSAMQLTLHLNEHSEYYYTAFFGDKDTFHLAWRKLGQEYSLVPRPPGVLGNNLVLVQFDPEGMRLFQHRCNAKWTLKERNMRVAGFLYEEECLALLRELPESFGETSLTPAEQIAYDEIIGINGFEPDFTVTLEGQLFGWQVEEDKDGVAVLILTYGDRRMCFLRKTPKGTWAGLWRYGDRALVEVLSTHECGGCEGGDTAVL